VSEPQAVAEMTLHLRWLGTVGWRRQAHLGEDQFHRLAGALQRTGDEIEIVRAVDQFGQPPAVAHGLAAAEIGHVGVGLSLQPELGVPAGLAVPDEITERGHAGSLSRGRLRQSLTVEMSGASTAFIPMA